MSNLEKFKHDHESLLKTEGFTKVYDLPHKIRYKRKDGLNLDIAWNQKNHMVEVVTRLSDGTKYNTSIDLDDPSGIFRRLVGQYHNPELRNSNENE